MKNGPVDDSPTSRSALGVRIASAKSPLKRRFLTICSLPALLLASHSLASAEIFESDKPNAISFPPVEARFVRMAMLDCPQGEPCIDELEVYGPSGGENLALASSGAKASASSFLPGYAIHRVEHLNDGRYGNSHSWIAARRQNEWAQIEFPKTMTTSSVVFSPRPRRELSRPDARTGGSARFPGWRFPGNPLPGQADFPNCLKEPPVKRIGYDMPSSAKT